MLFILFEESWLASAQIESLLTIATRTVTTTVVTNKLVGRSSAGQRTGTSVTGPSSRTAPGFAADRVAGSSASVAASAGSSSSAAVTGWQAFAADWPSSAGTPVAAAPPPEHPCSHSGICGCS